MEDKFYNEYGTLFSYTARFDPAHFDDRNFRDEWQDEVYAVAREQFKARGFSRIADFGCGSGFKLVKYFPSNATIGIEIEPSLSYLRQKYPDREWRSGYDLETVFNGADMIMSSDVIEHLDDPRTLMNAFVESSAKFFVISTPALELLAERNMSPRMGPPANQSHVREWTSAEFSRFVSSYLTVVDQRITNFEQCTQAVFAIKK